MVQGVSNIADGVVIGSAILKALDTLPDDAITEQRAEAIKNIVAHLKMALKQVVDFRCNAVPRTIYRVDDEMLFDWQKQHLVILFLFGFLAAYHSIQILYNFSRCYGFREMTTYVNRCLRCWT